MSDGDYRWRYADPEPRVRVCVVSPGGSVSVVELDARPETLTIGIDTYKQFAFDETVVYATAFPFTSKVEARLRDVLRVVDNPERWGA
jgi:hypothetical protein